MLNKINLPKSISLPRIIVVSLAIALIGIIIVQAVAINQNKDRIKSLDKIQVQLGSMNYDFSSGRATKVDDPSVAELQQLLEGMAGQDVAKGCTSSHYNLITASPDKKQVLLAYGCTHPSARMFVVKKDSGWETISPTNQFDIFGIPACRHVEENEIDKSIAPVCVEDPMNIDGNAKHTVR